MSVGRLAKSKSTVHFSFMSFLLVGKRYKIIWAVLHYRNAFWPNSYSILVDQLVDLETYKALQPSYCFSSK